MIIGGILAIWVRLHAWVHNERLLILLLYRFFNAAGGAKNLRRAGEWVLFVGVVRLGTVILSNLLGLLIWLFSRVVVKDGVFVGSRARRHCHLVAKS